MKTRIGVVAALALGTCLLARGQALSGIRPGRSIAQPAAVEYLYPEQVTVAAGKTSEVTLHFRIAQGLHINSHQPREKELIPTTFSIPEGFEFTIQAKIVATQGNHLVEAKLRFQACDKDACMPPKTITVPIDVIGK
jgi:hypothetical protein